MESRRWRCSHRVRNTGYFNRKSVRVVREIKEQETLGYFRIKKSECLLRKLELTME